MSFQNPSGIHLILLIFFFFPEEYDSDDLEIKLDLKKISLVVPKVL